MGEETLKEQMVGALIFEPADEITRQGFIDEYPGYDVHFENGNDAVITKNGETFLEIRSDK